MKSKVKRQETKGKSLGFYLVLMLLMFCFSEITCSAQQTSAETNKPCEFDKTKLSFKGNAIAQARCLLRPLSIYGAAGDELKELPQPLEKLIGKKVKVDKTKLREYLKSNNIKEEDLGGLLDSKLSFAKLSDGKTVQARYFMLHDVSTPNYLEKPFPENINTADWLLNDLEKRWRNVKVAHVFINRLGNSVTTVDFGSVLSEKNFGTKFARDILKADAKGLQIHVEMVQPRRSHPDGFKGNDGIAPDPGFTQAQYDRLALVYLSASLRKNEWLIPSYHATMDAGIKNAHDDPQNFNLEQWATSLDELLKRLR